MSKYYYLIAGLPEIDFGQERMPYSVRSFREEIYSQLDKKDRELLDLLLLPKDNANLIEILKLAQGGNMNEESLDGVPYTEGGIYQKEELAELVSSAVESSKCPAGMPEYMFGFAVRYLHAAESMPFPQDVLAGMYYDYASHSSNAMVRAWFVFNMDLNNIQTAFTARKYSLDAAPLIVGSNAVADALRTQGSRDWGLSTEVGFFNDLQKIQEIQDLAEKERKTDDLRLAWLEEQTFFSYFTVERLFAYMVKIGMIERWLLLDKERGQQLFRSLISELREQVEIPAEFGNNKKV